jgi:hypothetical protein
VRRVSNCIAVSSSSLPMSSFIAHAKRSFSKLSLAAISLNVLLGSVASLPAFTPIAGAVGPTTTTIVVRSADLDSTSSSPAVVAADGLDKWFFYNDQTDTVDNTIGSMVYGPATPLHGVGSAQITVSGAQQRNLATYQFKGVPLSTISELNFRTLSQSVGNGSGPNAAPYLNFNVDFNGSDSWQSRLVFVPKQNGTVTVDTWQTWDAINGGLAQWNYSGPSWPTAAAGPDFGGPVTPGTTLRTWNQILADYPGIKTRTTDSWMGIRVGEPYPAGFTGNIDSFSITVSGNQKIFDFEPVALPACGTSSFDSFTNGSVNGQDGWTETNATYDQAVVPNTYGYSTFGCKTLRVSDAVTSGGFDWIFMKPLTNSVGESAATAGAFSAGTKQSHYEVQFDVASTLSTYQPGLHISVSPDRGDGSRMSYLRFEDQADGIHVFFDDYNTTTQFNEEDIATINRTAPHTVKLAYDAVEGASNDIVKVYIDGVLKHTGTSWEDYYRFDPKASAEQSPRIVKTMIIQARGTATPANSGKGLLFDNFNLNAGQTSSTVTIAKYVNGVQATAMNTNSASFSMHAVFPGGQGDYNLTTTGFNNATPYMATTSDMPYGSDYSTYENPTASCTAANPFRLIGYTTGDTMTGAAMSAPSMTVPAFTNLSSDKYVIVWNKSCPAAPTLLSPANGATLTTAQMDKADWSDVADPFTPTTYIYESSHDTAVNPDGSFATPAYTSPALSDSEIATAGTSDGTYYWHVRSVDGAGHPGMWTTPWMFTIDNTAPAPTTEKVSIIKYMNGVHATAVNTNNATFNMTAVYSDSAIGSGSDPYTISATGNGTPNAYEASTIALQTGADYSTYEDASTSCTAAYPFTLAGYTTGDDMATAQAATPTMTVPAFTGLTSDKVVIVWNKTCPPAPTHLSPADGSTITTAQWDKSDWSDVTADPSMPISYYYEVATTDTNTNVDGSFVTPVYTSSALSTSEIATPGTSEGTYHFHVRAQDAAGNYGPWSTPWTVTVSNAPAETPAANFLGFRNQADGTYDSTPDILACGSTTASQYIAFEYADVGTDPSVSYEYKITAGPTAVGTTFVTGNTHVNGAIPEAGTYIVQITPKDTDGNTGAPVSCTMTYDPAYTTSSSSMSSSSVSDSSDSSSMSSVSSVGGEGVSSSSISSASSDSSSSSSEIVACTTAGLTGYWPMNEGTGTTTIDMTGTGHDGTLQGGTAWTTGAPAISPNASALSFDGSDDIVNVTNSNDFNYGAQDFTVSTFVKTTVGNRSILGNFSADHRGWGLYIYNTNQVNFFGYGTMGNNDSAKPAVVLDGNWHHIVGVYHHSGNDLTIDTYVDGVLLGSNTATVGDISANSTLYFGQYLPQPSLNGSLDDIRIYNRAISPSDIATLASGCSNPVVASSSSASSVSSFTPEGGTSSSSAGVVPQSFATPTQAADENSGSFRGSGTNRIGGALNFLFNKIFGKTRGSGVAPGGFGGGPNTPFSSDEKKLICSLQKALPSDANAAMYAWSASVLATNLNRDEAKVLKALKDPTFCPSTLQSSVQQKVALAPIAFPVSSAGYPVSSNATWNACITGKVTLQQIRNNPDKDSHGRALTCASYHTGSLWTQPDLHIFFTWNAKTKQITLPADYALVKDSSTM